MFGFKSISKSLTVVVTLVGSALEYYDYMLFALITPIMAPIFSAEHDKLSALTFGYAIVLLSALIRPLGAIIFGTLGDKKGRKIALFWAMSVMSISSFCIALLPGYAQIGVLAPIGLLVLRMLQTMSAAGELNGAAIFLIETIDTKERSRKGLASGLAWSFTVLGMLGGAYASYKSNVDTWRYPFFIGGLIGIAAIIMRFIPKTEHISKKVQEGAVHKLLKNAIAVMMIAAGISGMFYYTMIFLNGFWQCKMCAETVKRYNVYYFIIYSITLLASGIISDYVKHPHKIMAAASLLIACTAIPTFYFESLTFHIVNVILLGTFVGPSHAILFMLFPPQYRYRGVSLAYGIGTSIFGGITPFICTYFSKSIALFPSFWCIFVALIAFSGVILGSRTVAAMKRAI